MSHQSKIILIIFSVLVFTSISSAQVTVDPGTTSPKLQAQECAYRSDGLIGECFDCSHDCTLSENKAQARIAVEALDVGNRLITSTIYTEFTVGSTPQNEGNTVSSNLTYDVEWKGVWSFTTAIANYDPQTTITLWITDLTRNQKMGSIKLHEINQSSLGSIDIVDIGTGRDIGSETGELTMNLIRGNRYRVHLTITIELTAFTAGVMKLDYLRLDRGIWWNDLKIKISPDLEERIALLEERVDSLEVESERLRHDLENHTHTYLTGKGVGHNNVQAETSPAIIMDAELVDESQLDWLIDTNQINEPLPIQSVVLSNYPNPFNPATTIQYSIPEAGYTSIVLYNTLGQVVKTIIDEYKDAGTYLIEFDSKGLASGVYLYRLSTGNFSETRKLTILK